MSLASNVEARDSYKNYVLPIGTHTVKIKYQNVTQTKSFRITKNGIALEGIGAAMLHPELFTKNLVGIVDLGNLNCNAFLMNDYIPKPDTFFTDNKGYRYMLTNLTTTLSGKLATNLTELEVDAKLKGPKEKRWLFNKDIENSKELSKQYFKDEINGYIREICNSVKNYWNMSNTDTVFLGGTSLVFRDEIQAFCENEFGQAPLIYDDSQYENVKGFLKLLR